MVDYVKLALSRYTEFSGRSRRSEYWYFYLATVIGYVITSIIDNFIGFPLTYILFALAVFIPGLAVAVRRMHDTGRSGWWLFIGLIPLVGAILIIVWLATDSAAGPNEYGPNPKNAGGVPGGGYNPPPGQQWGQDPAQQFGQPTAQPGWGQQPPAQPDWGQQPPAQQPPAQPGWGQQPAQPPQQPPAQPGWGQQPAQPPAQPGWGQQPAQPPAQPGWGQPSGDQGYPPPPGQ